MKTCSIENFNQLANAISRIESYLGLNNSNDPNTITGKLKDFSTFITSESIESMKIICIDTNGKAKIASSDIISEAERIIGFSIENKNIDEEIQIQNFGLLKNENWNLDLNLPIMLDSNGNITQTPPTSGFWIRLGEVVSSNEIFINISLPILL